ncbi:ATP-binding protein [Holophaga foetida]|uniref:ATP-binding protein n=1 Tax=Holophaga foetida TaxID=35839 RepID=UPI0002472137|nr:ATP-binding protein [Holophaga foetida]
MGRVPLLWKLPIKGKLILIIMVASVSVLFLATASFWVQQRIHARQSMVRDTSMLARLMADRSTAALIFDDPKLCEENLAALRGIPSIVEGGIFDPRGGLVASYRSSDLQAVIPPANLGSTSHRFAGDSLIVFQPILTEGTHLGTVYLKADLGELRVVSRQYLLSAFAILCLGSLVALFLASRLQQVVSRPISMLTGTAQRVAGSQDYSMRVSKVYEDELGVLVDAFNGMLAQIQDRDRVLQESNERLESQVQARTGELRAAKDQLEAIFEAATSGIVLTQARTIVLCNRRLEEIFGYAPGEMIGRGTRMWYPDDATWESIGAAIAASALQGEMLIRELQLVRKDGSLFWGRMKLQSMDTSNPSDGVVGVIEDITTERENEESLRRALAAAETADRIKSAFLATMSHELRTPLNSIIGFTGILIQGLVGPLNAEQKKQLGMVRDSSNHLLELINDVLDISKIEAGQLEIVQESFDLRASLEKSVQILRPQAEKRGVPLELEIAPEVGRLRSDRRRVEQILMNLGSNAIKFTEHGKVLISCRVNGCEIEVRVRDTGIGIRDEDIGVLFQPFRQVDAGTTRKYEGTGLGLSICKRLVERMGGRIWVESVWGEGSTFTFVLPLEGREP